MQKKKTFFFILNNLIGFWTLVSTACVLVCVCRVNAVNIPLVTVVLLFTSLRIQNQMNETIFMWKRSFDKIKIEIKISEMAKRKHYSRITCWLHILLTI